MHFYRHVMQFLYDAMSKEGVLGSAEASKI